MGIPIDGTITEFQKKLEAKGWKLNIEESKARKIGCRHFNGTFFEENANMDAFYDPHSKIVYACASYIFCTDNNHMLDLVKNILEGIKQKYEDNIIKYNENEEKDTDDEYSVVIHFVIGTHDTILGNIVFRTTIVDKDTSVITIIYEDNNNHKKYNRDKEKRKYDDL